MNIANDRRDPQSKRPQGGGVSNADLERRGQARTIELAKRQSTTVFFGLAESFERNEPICAAGLKLNSLRPRAFKSAGQMAAALAPRKLNQPLDGDRQFSQRGQAAACRGHRDDLRNAPEVADGGLPNRHCERAKYTQAPSIRRWWRDERRGTWKRTSPMIEIGRGFGHCYFEAVSPPRPLPL